jgi:hypothetical protein
MKTTLLAMVMVTVAAAGGRAAPVDCEPARCAVQATIAANCPCAADNHGRYVSCVAHAVKQAAADGTIPINCKGKVVRCAARSTCGKDGFVVCQIPTDACDPTTLHCVGDTSIACTTDLDCGSKCKIKSSTDRCVALSGVVNETATNCCAACAQ